MSCGQLALDRLGVKVDMYLAAEIDKYAMSIAKKNYPNTVHLGDVTKLRGMDLPKIDLLMGGSPCQGFSFAGKQLNFDDPRSALFFEFVRLLEETKPKYFLLENVRMKQEYQDVISEHLGVKPIMINSALVSAQNRNRLYWTNIPNITQPEDKGIVLKDILEDLPFTQDPQYLKNKLNGKPRGEMVKTPDDKARCLNATMWKGQISSYVKNKIDNNPSATKKGKAYALTVSYTGAVAWNSIERKQRTMVPVCQSDEIDPNIVDGFYYRKLTPMECERLQTVPDGYTEGVSKTQKFKMLGNGWTVDVISHILKNI
jgi:DNA (cytosine-5)-methyltransferase 3A